MVCCLICGGIGRLSQLSDQPVPASPLSDMIECRCWHIRTRGSSFLARSCMTIAATEGFVLDASLFNQRQFRRWLCLKQNVVWNGLQRKLSRRPVEFQMCRVACPFKCQVKRLIAERQRRFGAADPLRGICCSFQNHLTVDDQLQASLHEGMKLVLFFAAKQQRTHPLSVEFPGWQPLVRNGISPGKCNIAVDPFHGNRADGVSRT